MEKVFFAGTGLGELAKKFGYSYDSYRGEGIKTDPGFEEIYQHLPEVKKRRADMEIRKQKQLEEGKAKFQYIKNCIPKLQELEWQCSMASEYAGLAYRLETFFESEDEQE